MEQGSDSEAVLKPNALNEEEGGAGVGGGHGFVFLHLVIFEYFECSIECNLIF